MTVLLFEIQSVKSKVDLSMLKGLAEQVQQFRIKFGGKFYLMIFAVHLFVIFELKTGKMTTSWNVL